MNHTTPPPNRQQFTSYGEWRKIAVRYVKDNAPANRRIFLRDTKTSKPWHRWVLPIAFLGIGCLTLWGGASIYGDYKNLTENGTRGSLVVTDRYSQTNKNGAVSWRLAVDVGSTSTRLKGSYSNEDIKGVEVGDTVDALYRDGNHPLAWWGADTGASSGSIALIIFGGVIIAVAAWLGFRYKGAVESKYLSFALGEIEAGRPLPV